MSTLYNKYRPMNFAEVVGQNHIKITLSNEIQSGKLAHAYLFCGPRAVGKTTLARTFAKSINCTSRKETDYEPCNKCEACLSLNNGSNIDIVEIDGASNTGVDNVRDNIIASARIHPVMNKFKVFIIDEIHMLSISAFNALLKIIEEPPSYVVFIFCTTEIHKVPTTIISRCQRFDFKRISISDSVKKLSYIAKEEGIEIDKKILEAVARKSEGYQRDAESLMGQIVSISGKKVTQDDADLVIPRNNVEQIIGLLTQLSKKDSSKAIKIVNDLLDSGSDIREFTENLIDMQRRIMLGKIDPQLYEELSLDLGESMESQINQLNGSLELSQIILMIELFSEARNSIRQNFIQQLPVELAIVKYCSQNISADRKIPEVQSVGNSSVPATTTVPKAGPALNIAQITDKWTEFIVNIKKYNHSLSFIMKACEPRISAEGDLALVFKYKLHKDRIDDPQIGAIVQKAMREVFGPNIRFRTIFDENIELKTTTPVETDLAGEVNETPKDSSDSGDMLNNILNTFGGKVVS